jgi:sugar lactone lactonase YvrE
MRALVAWFAVCCGSGLTQDFTDYKIEIVASSNIYGEGPVWSPEGYLIYSDSPNNRLMKWIPGQPPMVFREKSNGAMGNALDSQGRLYSCETHARRISRTDKKDRVEVIAEKWQGKRLNAPNDIVIRRDGHAYFTDPAFGKQQDTRELDFYGVFHVSPKGELDVLDKRQTRPNGIALAPNGKVLYVTDSDRHEVIAYDLDRAGAASNARTVISQIEGIPDGIKTDEKGNLYVAARYVFVYTPEGKELGNYRFAETPSNLAFGEGDLESLFVTARKSVYRLRLNVKGSVQY